MDTKIINRISAAVLLVAAIILVLMGNPSRVILLKASDDLGAIAMYGEDMIDPLVLIDWIIGETGDFIVVDLRNPSDYTDFSINGSVNIPFASLFTSEGFDQVPTHLKTVLVCEDGTRSGQAWSVLRIQGYEAYILKGGIKGWWRKIMTPLSAKELLLADLDPAELSAKLKAAREHLVGGGAIMDTPSEKNGTPPPPQIKSKPKKKKKSGGC
ncbi:hypothetical protein CEE37_11995 [candidate division LCP-89 bacterium B3_LCP]|uniref:Rhodanese domain-containing protein n=1 Tax=candidate division LCP-89 bacterium B3_LCP TaxID=2012998 RepID=A0A532UW21_UNCL8|nr:MAG: hypothetical protein CEE37_11995 [candidate division LCP-89 bacterium B3_LCP]